jgi:hypothetical protein
MTKKKPGFNWIVDAGLFAGFLIACLLDLTGLELHQWLGVAVAAVAIYHLIIHWPWVEAVTGRFLGHTSGQARVYYVIDAALAVGFLSILETGLLMSSWLSLPLPAYEAWRDAHILASIGTLTLVVIKIGLHWKWIAGVARRVVSRPAVPVLSGSAPAPARTTATASRREFLVLMGGVGTAAFLASAPGLRTVLSSPGGQAQAGLATTSAAQATGGGTPSPSSTASPAATATSAATSTPAPTATPATAKVNSAATGADSACIVRCSKRCSAPGRCRKYRDANGNGRCDLGECLT